MKTQRFLDNILTRLDRLAEAEKTNDPDYRIDRSAFLYMEPMNESAQENFAQCATCWKFTGKTCLEFSADDAVKPEGSCALYNYGAPRMDMAGKESKGCRPFEAEYIERPVRCENCVSFNTDEESPYCMRFRDLNKSKPEYYDLDEKVNAKGCCNANVSKE